MGTALLKIKIMPESPDTDLEAIKEKAKTISDIEITKFEEEPIAFGLKALIAFVRVNEDKGTDFIEKAFSEFEGVKSAEIADYRRAIE